MAGIDLQLRLSSSNEPHHIKQSKAVFFCHLSDCRNKRFYTTAHSVHKLPVTRDMMCQSCEDYRIGLKGRFCERLATGQPQVSSATPSLDTTIIGLVEDHQINEANEANSMTEMHAGKNRTVAREKRGKRKWNDDEQSEPPRAPLLLEKNGNSHANPLARVCYDSYGDIGVHFNKKSDGWEANLRVPRDFIPGYQKSGFQVFLGVYEFKDAAKDVRDRAALKLRETKGLIPTLNFPESRHTSYMEEHKDWSFRDFVWNFRRSGKRFTKGLSIMKGVAKRIKGKQVVYSATMHRTYFDQKQKVDYALGTYETEEEAGRAYDLALLFMFQNLREEEQLHVITNFRPSSYTEAQIQAAGKTCNNKDIRIA